MPCGTYVLRKDICIHTYTYVYTTENVPSEQRVAKCIAVPFLLSGLALQLVSSNKT